MTFIKKQKYALRTFKGIGLASVALGAIALTESTQADTQTLSIYDFSKTIDPGKSTIERKIDYGNQPVIHNPSNGSMYNEAIRSIELVLSNNGILRYRIALKDGVKLPPDAKFVFAFTGIPQADISASKITDNGKVVGSVTVARSFANYERSTISKMNTTKSVDEYIRLFESINQGSEPITPVVLEMNSDYTTKDTNRVIEFEIPVVDSHSTALSTASDHTVIYDSQNRPHAINRKVETALINPFDNRGVMGNKVTYKIELHYPVSLQSSHPFDFAGRTAGKSSTVPGIEVTYDIDISFSESLANSQQRTLLKRGDLLRADVADSNSLLKAVPTHKVGQIVEMELDEIATARDTVTSFTDSNKYTNLETSTSKPRKVKVRFELVTLNDNTKVWKVLDDVNVSLESVSLTYPGPELSRFDFREDWISRLGSDGYSKLIQSGKRSIRYDSNVPGFDASRLGVRYQLIRDGKAILDKMQGASIDINRNTATGTSSTGTLKVQYVDEAGKPIPNTQIETLAANKPWATVVTITPKNIPGYTYVRSDGDLSTVVGTGERIVKLYYKKNAPTYKYIPDDTHEPPFREEHPNPHDPGAPIEVRIGTKPTKKVTETPFNIQYIADETKDVGTKVTKTPGKKGKTTITTTYTINPQNGALIPNVGKPQTENPVNEVIIVGTKPKIDVVTTPITTIYKRDDSKDYGGKPVETPGREGKKTTKTTYKMDPKTGNVTPNTPTVENIDMIQRVVTLGTKPKVVTEKIPRPVRYIEDKTRNIDKPEVVTEGSDGTIVKTTTYDLDVKTGKVTEGKTTQTRTEPKERVIRVGKLPKVDKKPIPRPTRYVEDPTLDKGVKKVVTEGSDGDITTTTPYVLNSQNGTYTEGKPTTQRNEPKERVIKVGTKPKVVTETLPRSTRYIEDKTKNIDKPEVVTEGSDGKVVTTTPVILNVNDGTVKDGVPTVVRTEPKERVIRVGKLPKVDKKPIPRPTRYVEDPTLDKGVKKVVTEGSDGDITTTTPYVLNSQNGTYTEGKPTTQRNEPKERVIKVGTKPKVVTETIPRPTRYIEDKTKNIDKPEVVTEGEDGKIVTTTPVILNVNDGTVKDGVPTIVRTEPKERVIRVGKLPKVDKKPIPRPTRYVEDPTLDKGIQKVVTEGHDGDTTTTTPYVLNSQNGTYTEGKPTTQRNEPQERVIKVGTKPKVITETIPRKTIYIEDPKKLTDEPEIVTEGEDGQIITTTPHTLDPNTGNVTDGTPQVKRIEPQDRVIKVRNKPGVTEQIIPRPIKYIEDPNDDGTSVVEEGHDGKITTTTPRKVDPNTGKLVDDKPIVERVEPKPRVIKVGTKPKITEETLPYKTRTIEDPTLPKGREIVVQEGQNGKIIKRTPRKLNPQTGLVTDGEPVIERQEPKDRIIKVGTKTTDNTDSGKPNTPEQLDPEKTSQPINKRTRYVGDPELQNGKTIVVQEGEDGEIITTTPRTRNPKDGTITKGTPIVTRNDGKDRIIKVGTKPTVTTDVIKRKTKYIEDPNLPNGETRIVTDGSDGRITTTITYTLDELTGNITPSTPKVDKIDTVDKVIAVGTKPTFTDTDIPVETEYVDDPELFEGDEKVVDNGEPGRIRKIRTFTVDPNTGEVRETIKEEVTAMKKRVVKRGTKPKAIEKPKVEPKVEPEKPKVEPTVEPKVESKVETKKKLPETGDNTTTGAFGLGLLTLASIFKRRKNH